MSVASTLPAPRMNRTAAGLRSAASDIVAADLIVAVGDFTGGASEDLFTLSSHGLVDGDVLYALFETATGAITGGVGTRCVVNELSSSTFNVQDADGDTIENTADGTVVFLKVARGANSDVVELAVLPNLIVGTNDFTGGTVEDQVSASTGLQGAVDGDSIKLLYKSAAGAAAVAADATAYVKSPVVSATAQYCQTALTSGGAVADTTADGTVIFLKTS